MKKEIMKRAHEIARTMEGDYIARMAMALRMAWAEIRAPKLVKIVIGISKGTAYVAKITGLHPKYKFAREFVQATEKNRSWSGKNGTNTYYITEEGIYEKAYGSEREYYLIKNGVAQQIDLSAVLAMVG